MTTTEHRKLTEPLESVTAIFGMLLLVALAAGVLFSIAGSGSFGGFGHAAVCATQPNTGYGGSGWTTRASISSVTLWSAARCEESGTPSWFPSITAPRVVIRCTES